MTKPETLEDVLAIGTNSARHKKLVWYLDDAFDTGMTKADVINYVANIADLTPVERTWMGYMIFQRLLMMKMGPLGDMVVKRL
jgi:hypothetical protein